MKPFLVDVPVRVNIWIRPECQKKQFEVLKQARPSILFLVSDGGRNEKEWEAIHQNRKLIDEGIDWDCTVYRFYEKENNGLYGIGNKYIPFLWSTVDRCIFLEDDHVPSVSYFRFCAELLEKYKDDERIEAICGMNHCGILGKANTDYFFASQGSIWGLAAWKRSHDCWDREFNYGNDAYIMGLLKKRTRNIKVFWKRLKGYAEKGVHENHVAGGEFFHTLEIHAQHRLYIIPTKNMISNIGCTANGAHAVEYKLLPHGIRKVFNMKTYEINFPLKHAKYVIEDTDYNKAVNRIMAVGHPMVELWRRVESAFLAVRYTGFKGAFMRLKKKIVRKSTIEK